MSLVDVLFNAAGGGVLGSVLHCVTDWVDTKNKIALMQAQVNAAEKTEAWKAFAASQAGSDSLAIPANTPAWASALYLCVDAVKQLMRPLLALAGVGIITSVYLSSTPAVREQITSEVIFGSFTAVFWYFGARYARVTK